MTAPRGFTLIELLAATALAAVLMVAVLSVTASLSDPRRAMVETTTQVGEWEPMLRELLERDVRQARHVEVDGDVIVLETLVFLNPRDTMQAHRPVRVRYGYEQEAGLLVRDQMDLLERSDRARSVALVAAGVAGFEAELSSGVAEAAAGSADAPPGELRVRIRMADDVRERPIEVSIALR